ncbi:hypothetical protein M8J76_011060 [Diaphorina citri]|nr:hypothetical protein M8J76_011060 [Diaphorina citri]
MISSQFQIKKRRSFVHKSGKGHKRNPVKLNGSARDLGENQDDPLHGGVDQDIGRDKSNTPSLKLCKKWLIGELKRLKRENATLKSHLDSPTEGLSSLKEKLTRSHQKRTALKRKYKALCHIHKSSLIELYNLAVQESNGLRNDISLLNNVIHKLNEELSRYENNPGVAREPPTQTMDVKVTKLTSLKELHIFEPLMRSYEALLVDRTALIDKYRRDHTLLRDQNKSLEEENHELRKTLAEFESSVAVNNHKIESLIINKDLLAEQNEVLIHKVNLFNTTLNLLLSKYETLEIKNLQLSLKNNSLIRAAKLAEMRSKFHHPQAANLDRTKVDSDQSIAPNFDQSKYALSKDRFHQPKLDQSLDANFNQPKVANLGRSEYTPISDKSQHTTEMNLDPYDQNDKTKGRKDSDGFFGLFPSEILVKDEMEKVNKSEKALANKNSDIDQTGRALVSVDEIPDHLVKDEMERHKKTNKSKNEFVNENLDDEILQKKTNKSNNKFANENIENKNIVNENEIQLRKTINQLGREIVALRERNALLASRNLDGHAQCISKSVHENIVRYFERTFDELTEKYREQVKREREGKPKQLEEKSSQQIMEMEQIHHQLTLEEKLPQQKLKLKRQPQQKVKILEENQQQAYLQQQQQQYDKLEENLQRVQNQQENYPKIQYHQKLEADQQQIQVNQKEQIHLQQKHLQEKLQGNKQGHLQKQIPVQSYPTQLPAHSQHQQQQQGYQSKQQPYQKEQQSLLQKQPEKLKQNQVQEQQPQRQQQIPKDNQHLEGNQKQIQQPLQGKKLQGKVTGFKKLDQIQVKLRKDHEQLERNDPKQQGYTQRQEEMETKQHGYLKRQEELKDHQQVQQNVKHIEEKRFYFQQTKEKELPKDHQGRQYQEMETKQHGFLKRQEELKEHLPNQQNVKVMEEKRFYFQQPRDGETFKEDEQKRQQEQQQQQQQQERHQQQPLKSKDSHQGMQEKMEDLDARTRL